MSSLSLLLVPILGALICFAVPPKASRLVALLTSLVGVVIATCLYVSFDASNRGYQFSLSFPWIQSLGVSFGIGIDGLSLPLLVLTKAMVPIAILASWNEQRHTKLFMALYLILDAAMTGTFLSTDLFVFYIFWELMLIPMFLLIGIWGSQDRVFASLKFFLYTFAGSVLMLVALFYLFSHPLTPSSHIPSFYSFRFLPGPVLWGLSTEDIVFLAFAIAFLIKIPLFPFHTWLPDAHVQAPAGGSILLAAVLLKMGAYGLLRFAIPICPNAFERFASPMAILSLIGAIYGAWVAFQQNDLKKLVAYSSVSHLALVVLGICSRNAQGLSGALLQLVNHGVSTGALFLLVGVLYDRRHTRDFAQYGGLAAVVPKFSFFLVVAACASMGVPGLNGFVGEFLILSGTFLRSPLWAGVAVFVVIFGAAYTLLLLKKLLYGPVSVAENASLADLRWQEFSALCVLSVAMIAFGLFPRLILDKANPMISHYWSVGSSR